MVLLASSGSGPGWHGTPYSAQDRPLQQRKEQAVDVSTAEAEEGPI